MSITPAAPSDPSAQTPEDAQRAGRILRVVFILFCVEIGLVLLLLPWTLLWDNNYFFGLDSEWRRFWLNSFVRGGISGLGLVNIWIALLEVLRLRRRR